jgi:hypothetical protein
MIQSYKRGTGGTSIGCVGCFAVLFADGLQPFTVPITALSMDQIGRLVDIAPVLEHIVVRTRYDKIDAPQDKFLGAASSAFSHYEKKLWYVLPGLFVHHFYDFLC